MGRRSSSAASVPSESSSSVEPTRSVNNNVTTRPNPGRPGGRSGRGLCPASRGPLEVGLVAQDVTLETLQHAARFEAELLAQHGPQLLIGPQSVGLAPGPVEASMRWAHKRSRRGWARVKASSSATSSPWRPQARSPRLAPRARPGGLPQAGGLGPAKGRRHVAKASPHKASASPKVAAASSGCPAPPAPVPGL